jgi:hypothetical protein
MNIWVIYTFLAVTNNALNIPVQIFVCMYVFILLGVELLVLWQLCLTSFFLGGRVRLRALHLQSRGSTAWATPPVHFALVFGDGVTQTICSGCPQTMILSISASQIAWITGMSHYCLAMFNFLKNCQTVFQRGHTILQGFSFFTSLPAIFIVSCFTIAILVALKGKWELKYNEKSLHAP